MIYCKHKTIMPMLNKGYVNQICRLHNKPCNTKVCTACPDYDQDLNAHVIEVDFPKRTDQEIEQISQVCHECPLFKVKDQVCEKMPYEWATVDVFAEFPNNHCPEKKW